MGKGLPLVSIIIPVYNVALYLTEALDSVIHQTYVNLEIILIDDGSTDGSDKICDEYARMSEYIHVVHQKNRGLSAARNVGLNLATGQIVAFLDSDDAYKPNYISVMVSTLIYEEVDLVLCKYNVHETDEQMQQIGIERTYPVATQGKYSRTEALHCLLYGTINHHMWNKVFRRELWEDLRFPVGHVYEDIDTTYQILDRIKALYVIDQALYLQRKRSGSITSTHSISIEYDQLLAYSHFKEYVEKHTPEIFTEEQLIKCRQAHLNLMIGYYRIILKETNNSIDDKELRKQIINVGSEISIGNCPFHRRIYYWMICYCPWLIQVVYPIYRNVQVERKTYINKRDIAKNRFGLMEQCEKE